MRHQLGLVVALGAGVLVASAAVQAQSARTLVIGAEVGPATSLRVSTSVLDLSPSGAGGPHVIGHVDVEARARARSAGEVVLTVQALRDPGELAGGPGADPLVIGYDGAGAGFVAGTLSTEPQIAGRWLGSGVRHGQLLFTLQAGRIAVGGTVPLRFVLSAP